MNEYTWCILVLLWAMWVKVGERYQDSEPISGARLLLSLSTAQDPAKQNQLSDPWRSQAHHLILISQTEQVNSLCFGSAVLPLPPDSNLIRKVQVSDPSNEASSQSWMIDVLQLEVFYTFTERRGEKCECEGMNNALEDGCSQMKGHLWLIFFLAFLFWNGKRKKKKRLLFSL